MNKYINYHMIYITINIKSMISIKQELIIRFVKYILHLIITKLAESILNQS